MSAGNRGITRREMLATVAGGAALLALEPLRGRAAEPPPSTRVVRVESKRLWNGDARDPVVVAAMLERGLMALSGAPTLVEAWQRYVSPEMRVGLKINLLGRPFVYTAPEITEAAVVGLVAAGVKAEKITVWDRFADHFKPTRYALGKGAHGESIVASGKFHKRTRLQGSKGKAALDTMVTDHTDVTVSLPVLKDHATAGVTLALKNIAFGCYDHYSSAHENNCEPFITEACAHFAKHAKAPLVIMDATEACFDNGPKPSDRDRLWRENAIYFATDPVALDLVCRKVIMDQRKARGLSDKTAEAHHIDAAARKGLGVGDPSRIAVVTLAV